MTFRYLAATVINVLTWGNGYALAGRLTQEEILASDPNVWELAWMIPVIPMCVFLGSILYLAWGYNPKEFWKTLKEAVAS